VIPDPWQHLKSITAARIALGRAGGSLPTAELLDFGLAHARARDAVLSQWNTDPLVGQIASLGYPVETFSSAATSRDEYLQRPDLGRRLSEESRKRLNKPELAPCDLVIVVSDGLSALAAERHAAPVLTHLLPRLAKDDWNIGPIVLVNYGRVAVEDEVGELLQAQFSLILLGERPGLGAPDSLGAYLVHRPRVGLTDAQRNCVSNIRDEGLPPPTAAATLHYLLTQARHRKLSGVALKDERTMHLHETPAPSRKLEG
jgi:ethanolamine ammonia-lyase small subunit